MQENRIVVMGGSFNPPTIAHLHLMEAAMKTIGARKGIFVPVGNAYLKRKMRRAEHPVCLSEELRMQMLEAMIRDNPDLMVTDIEMQDPTLYTERTMSALQEQYLDWKLCFLMGADKLPLARHWAQKTDFLDRYTAAIVCRDEEDPLWEIREDPDLARYEGSFLLVPQPEGVEAVSSTVIRRSFLAGTPDQAREDLHEKVWELFRELKPEDYPPEIERFQKEYEFLSNSFAATVEMDGLFYRNAEAAFQAARCADEKDRKRFLTCDGGGAKSIAAKVRPRADWEQVQLEMMARVLRLKFTQYPSLGEKLKETGNAVLVNGNNGKDLYWGMDLYTCQGENHLGRLLMQLREEI